jgi:hypothetical protein
MNIWMSTNGSIKLSAINSKSRPYRHLCFSLFPTQGSCFHSLINIILAPMLGYLVLLVWPRKKTLG